jgi:hypothetical protein
MIIKQIRNAALITEYAGIKFLDSMLAEKGAYPGSEGSMNSHLRNPSSSCLWNSTKSSRSTR